MNKSFHEVVTSRRSIRSFSSEPVDIDEILLLLEHAIYAPSPANMQDFKFVISQNEDVLRALPDMCMEQDWIAQGSAVIAVCSEVSRVEEWFGDRAKELADQTTGGVVQTILLAASANNIGACWVAGFDQDPVKKLFNIPSSVSLQALVVLGHPYSKPDPRVEKDIYPLTFFDFYGNDLHDLTSVNHDYSVKLEKKLSSLQSSAKKSSSQLQKQVDKLKKFFFK